MSYSSNFLGHLKTVNTHRGWVKYFCKIAGIPKQGRKHDRSKYTPTEFLESVRYYTGDRSPIDNCKDIRGYSMAWLHHKSHNKHHWEYWVDDFSKGMRPIMMPYNYAVEMICDFLGAEMAYKGLKKGFMWSLPTDFTTYFGEEKSLGLMQDEYNWWQERRKIVVMHPYTKEFVDIVFYNLALKGFKWFSARHLRASYDLATRQIYFDGEAGEVIPVKYDEKIEGVNNEEDSNRG